MKLDKDIEKMSLAARGQELMRVRKLIRTHKKKKDNARCWHTDLQLYSATLPEGSRGAGEMSLPLPLLIQNCKKYIRGQQCTLHGCKKKGKHFGTR